MKTKVVWAVILLVLFPKCAYSQLSFGQPEKINDEWRFILKDVDGAQSPNYNDTRWQNVDLPHDWSIKESLSPTLASATGYLPGGIGWYRKTIYIPQEKQGGKIYLYFEGIYNRSEVFINEQSLGKRPSGYASFAFDATPWIEYGKDNLIAVRADHSRSADSRWYTGSGIYRNAWLVYAKPIHIAQWGVYAYPKAVTKKNAVISVDVEIENGSTTTGSPLTITNELLSQEGKVVAKETKKLSAPAGQHVQTNMELKVSNPQLWSIETPNLYQLKTTVLQGNKVIDETTTTTGIRSYTFDPNTGFALNGQALKVKGVCLHHDAGVLGVSVPKEVWKRRLLTLKELGCNAIRCSHNPHAPELYELCDELGLLVMDEAFDEWEFPKRKWLEGWNKGTPGFDGIVDFFEAWGERDLADMVRRDRNHVSIFSWSIGNEIDYPNDPYSHPVLNGTGKDGFTQPIFGGYQKEAPDAMRLGTIAKKLVSVVRQYDKSRPVTAALAGVAMSNETEYPGALDIAGYNYTESFYLPDHKKYPGRVIYGSENGHSFDAWKAVTENPYIFGQFLWTGIDYLGEAGSWPSRGSSAGLLDLGGFVKPKGYFRQSLWSDKPMAYIGTYPLMQNNERTPSIDALPSWNYDANQTVRVVCYTNAPKARLELNGKQVGDMQDYNHQTGIIYWDIPYQAGKLEVTGLDKDNKEITRYAIQSSKQPDALTICHVEKATDRNKGLTQIIVQVVDENGVPVVLSNNEVTCHISGPAKLLGLEAGDMTDMTDYTDNKQRVFHGRLIAYIQTSGEEGEIKVQFSSPWLKSTETIIQAANSDWTNLLDENLSQWHIYQSFENMGSDGKPVLNEDNTIPEPVGYDKNKENVFSVIKENGEPILHINGKIYGCLFTKESYRNYHLKLQYKFGTAKYPPRRDKAKDSGILYHSQGEAGVDYWHSWMLGQEFQVMEAGTDEGVSGDYWPIANAQINIRALKNNDTYTYNQGADLIGFGANNPGGHCAAIANYTNPSGEWTTLELICYEGKSLHIVNGKIVMTLENSSYWNGTESIPLVEGKIQLQCESAEVFYKDIQIKEINELPAISVIEQ